MRRLREPVAQRCKEVEQSRHNRFDESSPEEPKQFEVIPARQVGNVGFACNILPPYVWVESSEEEVK